MENVAVSHNPNPSQVYPVNVQVDGCNMLKEKTAAPINPVLNLSRLLKSAAIGLIVVNHVCQWCREVWGILLQKECTIKSAAGVTIAAHCLVSRRHKQLIWLKKKKKCIL